MTETVIANTQPVDPFAFEDPRFAGVDTTRHKDDLPALPNDDWYDPAAAAVSAARPRSRQTLLQELAELAANEHDPDVIEAQDILDAEADEIIAATVPAPVVSIPVVPPPAPVADEPEVISYPDGSSVTIVKDGHGWSAVLDSNTGGGVETFKGRTKDEMWRNLAAGKINATRKINSLNRQLKLGVQKPDATLVPVTTVSRELTADEAFEIKTQLANNPDLALEKWFQKKTGRSVAQLVALAERGEAADEKLRVETEARQFRADYPEYYPTDKNLKDLDDYLVKNNLEWNAQNLGTAFEELSEAGLLEIVPKTVIVPAPVSAPAATPVAATPVTVPAPVVPTPVTATPPVTDPRIVGTRRRARAGLGIQPTEATATVEVVSTTPPSVEELDNLDNDQINQLFAGVRRLRAQSARR